MREGEGPKAWYWIGVSILLWIVVVVVSSAEGWLGRLSPYAVPVIAFGMMLLVAAIYRTVHVVGVAVRGVSLRAITAVHISRMAATPLFFWYGRHGLLPHLFTSRAGWGDLLAGALALAVVLFWPRASGYWVVHVVGMLDFLDAFGTAMLMTRTHFGSMAAVSGLPMALIPFFGVGLLGGTHLIVYGRLLRGAGGGRKEAAAMQQ